MRRSGMWCQQIVDALEVLDEPGVAVARTKVGASRAHMAAGD
jgi:hypothetical protein